MINEQVYGGYACLLPGNYIIRVYMHFEFEDGLDVDYPISFLGGNSYVNVNIGKGQTTTITAVCGSTSQLP